MNPLKVNLPDWAVSNDLARTFVPDYGFLHDYVEYMESSTDAPTIYHIGSALSMMTAACPYCDVIEISNEGVNKQPLILWIALVGYSGDRKSTSMEAAVALLEQFRMATSEKHATLTLDGSIEAWHDHLVKNPNMLAYRDELSMLFDSRQKGYLKNLFPWLLELYSGNPKIRILKSSHRGEDGEQESDEKQIIIERPRVSLLGGIPPEVLLTSSTAGDWASGFLARFKFFAAMREDWKTTRTQDPVVERSLCQWLHRVAWRSRGHIVIPQDVGTMLNEWVWDNIEIPRRRREEHQDLLSQFTRLQEFGIRSAGIYAISRRFKPQTDEDGRIVVDKSDMRLVLRLLEALRDSSRALFKHTRSSTDTKEGQEILNWIRSKKDSGAWRLEIAEHFPQYSPSTIYRRLQELIEMDLLSKNREKNPKTGRRSDRYVSVSH